MLLHKQFVRYAVVGLVSNIGIYGLYIAATWLGSGPKATMTFLYGFGVVQTYLFNKRWAFQFKGEPRLAFARYAIAYILGYFVNLLSLILFVDLLKLPHQLIQGVMIVLVAILLFLAQKYWVFRQTPGSGSV